jgi:hypothetical protein
VIIGRNDDKRLTALVIAAGLAAMLAPIRQNWRATPRDGFPLSYYPMFSAARRKTYTVYHLVGLTGDGEQRLLHYSYGGAGGLNSVRRQMRLLARGGRADALCEAAARRLCERCDAALDDVVTVQLVRSTYRVADYYAGDTRPVREKVFATRAVERERRA